ncbi:c-type cytochrome [Luteimonas chenhongjianii]|uniref:c-type cytochrome n=1 Tax=Luteimonas chenhongjianii TaxID=2006110 RepID=UPI0012FE308F|nr:cytochrome c [Luteimonas chenhongjianii]
MTRQFTLAACLALVPLVLPVSAQDVPAAPSPTPQTPQAAASAATTTAEQPTHTPLTGDAATGRQLTYTCQGCHGVEGYRNIYPHYHVPMIGGQSPEYLVNALHEYKRGTRRHPTMQAQAQSFTDQDIADIAAFLSELSK